MVFKRVSAKMRGCGWQEALALLLSLKNIDTPFYKENTNLHIASCSRNNAQSSKRKWFS